MYSFPLMKQVYESSELLRIGYVETDGYFRPSPSMARAFRETKDLLEKAGHTVHTAQLFMLNSRFINAVTIHYKKDGGRAYVAFVTCLNKGTMV